MNAVLPQMLCESRGSDAIVLEDKSVTTRCLPEPLELKPKRSPWFLWFGIAGVACLVLASGVRLFKRRWAGA